jgi:hypothetical protein
MAGTAEKITKMKERRLDQSQEAVGAIGLSQRETGSLNPGIFI